MLSSAEVCLRIARTGILRLAAIAALALFVAAAPAALPVGAPAPPLTVPTLTGGTFDLAALRGHVVIVHFWATWCPSCRDEMQAFDSFHRAHHGDGVELVCVSLDRRRDLGEVRKVMQQFTFPAALWSGASVNGFDQPEALPLTYVIDGEGVVRVVLAPGKGPLSSERLESIVLPLVEGRSDTRSL